MRRKFVTVLCMSVFLFFQKPALAHTEDDPFVADLIAGGGNEKSAMDVGDILVWNDGEYLYVKYLIEDPDWCLTETHLEVAPSPDDIPQKNGNPIPGKFTYKAEHACVMEYTIPIPLVWDVLTDLSIAAHSVVLDLTSEETMWVYSDGTGTETFTAYSGPGNGSFLCLDGSPREGEAVPAWQHSAWQSDVNPQFTYGTWIWEAYEAVNPVCGDIVDFEEAFTIPGFPRCGTLWVTADNGYVANVNGTPVGDDGVSGDWRNSNLFEEYVTTARAAWSSVEEYDILGQLLMGQNLFLFETANEYFNTDDGHGSAGTTASNPGGLIYEAEICYADEDETAWGAGLDFPGKNWATYLTYTVQEACTPGEIIWQIGDEEAEQMDNPVDELNWPGTFGVFPTFPDPFVIGTNSDIEFPWNSNHNQSYAVDFDVQFDYSGPPVTARLTVSWSPGRSGVEQKDVWLDGSPLGETGEIPGTAVSGWWEEMQRREDTWEFCLNPGSHALRFIHTKGDGTLWDFVRLEVLECACPNGVVP